MTPVSIKKFNLAFKVGKEGERLIVNNCLMSQRREEGTGEMDIWVWRRSVLDKDVF